MYIIYIYIHVFIYIFIFIYLFIVIYFIYKSPKFKHSSIFWRYPMHSISFHIYLYTPGYTSSINIHMYNIIYIYIIMMCVGAFPAPFFPRHPRFAVPKGLTCSSGPSVSDWMRSVTLAMISWRVMPLGSKGWLQTSLKTMFVGKIKSKIIC